MCVSLNNLPHYISIGNQQNGETNQRFGVLGNFHFRYACTFALIKAKPRQISFHFILNMQFQSEQTTHAPQIPGCSQNHSLKMNLFKSRCGFQLQYWNWRCKLQTLGESTKTVHLLLYFDVRDEWRNGKKFANLHVQIWLCHTYQRTHAHTLHVALSCN